MPGCLPDPSPHVPPANSRGSRVGVGNVNFGGGSEIWWHSEWNKWVFQRKSICEPWCMFWVVAFCRGPGGGHLLECTSCILPMNYIELGTFLNGPWLDLALTLMRNVSLRSWSCFVLFCLFSVFDIFQSLNQEDIDVNYTLSWEGFSYPYEGKSCSHRIHDCHSGGILQVIHLAMVVQTKKLRTGNTQLAQLGVHRANHALLDEISRYSPKSLLFVY